MIAVTGSHNLRHDFRECHDHSSGVHYFGSRNLRTNFLVWNKLFAALAWLAHNTVIYFDFIYFQKLKSRRFKF